jgi:hypothetical protein
MERVHTQIDTEARNAKMTVFEKRTLLMYLCVSTVGVGCLLVVVVLVIIILLVSNNVVLF